MFFKKVACFTDIHFGMKGNSRVHNDDCEAFIYWFIEQAKLHGCETCIFLGDWHHHRASTNVSTMNYTVSNMERLGQAFEKVYVLMGNHDLFYREKREINSMEFIRNIPNIHLVNEWIVEDDVALIPWIVGDEWKKIQKMKQQYVFGHFELPYFKMNAMVEMPDHGGITAKDISNPEYVFSGHFHARQYKGNIHYIGNAFPHNYADAGDNARGAMFLNWGEEPIYVDWPDCPKYIMMGLRELLGKPEEYLDENTHARIKLDVGISYEEANFIRETFAKQFNVRELQLIPIKEEEEAFEGTEVQFESVDQIVISQLETIDSQIVDKEKLIELYREIIV